MITSPFEVSVGTVRRTFPGAETCDVQTFRGSDEPFKFQLRIGNPRIFGLWVSTSRRTEV